MKSRLPKRESGTPVAGAFLAQLCESLDRSVPGLRTTLLIVGLIATAARTGPSADFLFVTGLLFHCAIWFESWWADRQSN